MMADHDISKASEAARAARAQRLRQLRQKRNAQLRLASRHKRLAREHFGKGLGAGKRAEELAREIRAIEQEDA